MRMVISLKATNGHVCMSYHKYTLLQIRNGSYLASWVSLISSKVLTDTDYCYKKDWDHSWTYLLVMVPLNRDKSQRECFHLSTRTHQEVSRIDRWKQLLCLLACSIIVLFQLSMHTTICPAQRMVCWVCNTVRVCFKPDCSPILFRSSHVLGSSKLAQAHPTMYCSILLVVK